MFTWILVLVVLMAGGGNGKKRRLSSAQQPEEDVGSEYNPGDDSDRGSPEEDMETVSAGVRSKKKERVKGKGKSKGKGKGKGKERVDESGEAQTYSRARTGGISINEPGEASPPRAPAPVDPRRLRLYSSKQCVGERAVGVASLIEKVPGFQALYENGNLREICAFPEHTGFGLELIREFYMRAGHLLESEGGPFSFTTSVRGLDMMITPESIGNVLETPAWTGGVDYLNAGFDPSDDWTRILRSICVAGAENNGGAILSKDLRIEYRFLNFVVCYNVMPLANTKVIRWDRVLYMYLLGRPNLVHERNINLNIPFLIWKRMAREIKTASQKDRLPFPLLIMRILRLHNVDVTCTSYEHSLGPISDATITKSHVQLHGHSSPQPEAPAPASPPIATSDTEASISSVYREQQRLSGELARQGAVLDQLTAEQAASRHDMAQIKRRQGRISRLLRVLCEKMGCGSSELPLPDTDSE